MEMLTSMTLASMWSTIINAFAGWIVNYGWAIIVFTIVLKLVLSPLDILQRVSSQKQARVMGAMQPELDELKKKYADNPEKLNAEQNKVYQKYKRHRRRCCRLFYGRWLLPFRQRICDEPGRQYCPDASGHGSGCAGSAGNSG